MTKTARPTFNLENTSSSFKIIAGIDEAGCGPLAGPVVAGAVIFLTQDLPDALQSLIHDSKKLTEKKRDAAFEIMNKLSGTVLHYGVGIAEVAEIDQLNIGRATRLAMERSVLALSIPPEFALIDGIRKPNLGCPSMTVIKGDATSLSIAAASIFAKVTRDRLMQALDLHYPAYGWRKNAGYGTAHHLQAIQTHGITPYHRRSFEPIKTMVGGPVQGELF
ncbi:MAG: ribonuclease HII [Candidatus Paracaedibacteraceae bacterium]|nr:ribonuclease HII [Candidatus Paracaedibacteraceae bacterium]